jgi:hypothetical protein
MLNWIKELLAVLLSVKAPNLVAESKHFLQNLLAVLNIKLDQGLLVLQLTLNLFKCCLDVRQQRSDLLSLFGHFCFYHIYLFWIQFHVLLFVLQ